MKKHKKEITGLSNWNSGNVYCPGNCSNYGKLKGEEFIADKTVAVIDSCRHRNHYPRETMVATYYSKRFQGNEKRQVAKDIAAMP